MNDFENIITEKLFDEFMETNHKYYDYIVVLLFLLLLFIGVLVVVSVWVYPTIWWKLGLSWLFAIIVYIIYVSISIRIYNREFLEFLMKRNRKSKYD